MEVPKRTRIYKIVTADSAENLEKEVNKLLDAGWELAGGVTVSIVTDWRTREYYTQAMITTL